jgi:hypothetical protein
VFNSQPQLLQIALDKKDVVYTPDWVARDMVEFFKPSGRILEPAAGDGAILKYLPGADWCEIERGRDFFSCKTHYDWIITNPPYHKLRLWIYHAIEISNNFVYLINPGLLINAIRLLQSVYEFGGIVAMRIYGAGGELGFPMGNTTGAVHIQKDYHGPMDISFYS